MEYKEISRKKETITNIIVNTLVEMTFYINGKPIIKEVEVSHFDPLNEKGIIDEDKIKLGIENRYTSELRELTETKKLL